jgi:PD-(D/E)XK endonuclease
MRATQRKGDIAKARAVAMFTQMGCDVSIPLTESAFYDLIVDDGHRLYRVRDQTARNSSLRSVMLGGAR